MRTHLRSILVSGIVMAGACGIPAVYADDVPASANTAKLATGLSAVSKLLALMDSDKNGKISKEEFMQFMQAEFDFADKNKDGQLDPAELKALVYRLNHPLAGVQTAAK